MDKTRDKLIAIRVTMREYAILKDAARRQGRDMSNYIRFHIVTQALHEMGWEEERRGQ